MVSVGRLSSHLPSCRRLVDKRFWPHRCVGSGVRVGRVPDSFEILSHNNHKSKTMADDGSTAVAAAPPPTPRERGTLRDTLPGRPFAIFLILTACTVCSALAASLVVYSFPDRYEFANDATVYLFLVASLGSVSTAVGIVFGDSLTHLLAFGVAVRDRDVQSMSNYV